VNRRDEIVAAIVRLTHAKGYPPTVREIGDAVGLSSSSTVQHYLDDLVYAGRIRHEPTKARTIQVIEA
jgi:repressor LexA